MNDIDIYKNIFETINIENKKRITPIFYDSVDCELDVKYSDKSENNLFDIFYPKNMTGKLPVIFVVHGGGYVSGNKRENQTFCGIMAKKGYCVVNMEYTKCDPKKRQFFIDEIKEFYMLLDFIKSNPKYAGHIDLNNVFLSGDSAGAHIVSVIANIQNNFFLNTGFGFDSNMGIKGLILTSPFFGPVKSSIKGKNLFERILFGEFGNDVLSKRCITFDYLTKEFPPTIMFSSVNDFVVKGHEKKFCKIAKTIGFPVERYVICKGHKLTHDSFIKYADKYNNCVEKLISFCDDIVAGKQKTGVHQEKIYETTEAKKNTDLEKTL